MRIEYVSPVGRAWPLDKKGGQRGVFCLVEGIQDWCGKTQALTSSSPVYPGQVFRAQSVQPIEGSMQVFVLGRSREDFGVLMRQWRSDWSRSVPGTLRVIGGSRGQVSLPVRLTAGMTDCGSVQPVAEGRGLKVNVPFIGDRGFWAAETESGTGRVVVRNAGDVMIWPRFRWSGRATSLQLPSGARVSVPAAGGERVWFLDPAQSSIVVDAHGVPDRPLWNQLVRNAAGEGVPPGQERTYVVGSGGRVEWEQGVFDPWM